MTSWQDEYLVALQERDQGEKASYRKLDDDMIAAFADLQDRTAALEAEKLAREPTDTKRDPAVPYTDNQGTAQMRSDLAQALRSNTQLQSRIKAAEAELARLKAKSKTDTRQIEDLSRERTSLTKKLKDRDEEGRGKTKLLGNVHDEVISLELQLNMSERKNRDLKAENKELIDRWMASKGAEAEEMNRVFQVGSEKK